MINPWIVLLSAMLLMTMLNVFIIMRNLTPSLNDNEPEAVYDLRVVSKEHLRHVPEVMPGTFSIVLVDHNESMLFKTIDSILTNSTPSLLGEILVIDDGSPTPVVYNHSKVRIIRNDVRTGLIQARNTGGNEARCEYLAIMDAHIKVAKGWLDQPYELMKKDYRTMVSPVVFIMDQEHFEFQPGRNGLMSSAGFYWTFRHKWRSGVPGTMQTAATMGEFFITKRWWTEIEGMDTGMLQWGGENIDISLRTWMCGGQIVVADKTYIAHAFRKKAPYKVDVKNVARNAARSAEVWLGPEYIHKFYKARKIKRGSIDYGDISKPLAMKERLKCHNFSWFVEKFKGISPCDHDDKNCGNYRNVEPKQLDPRFY